MGDLTVDKDVFGVPKHHLIIEKVTKEGLSKVSLQN
jgi:hypothetical protein